jgi:cytidylate kinase
MIPHTYLEHGLSILHTRLQQPSQSSRIGPRVEFSPFITLSRETGAGATTIGQLLLPQLDRELVSEGHDWVLLDKNLLTQALTHHHLPERLAAFLPEDSISETKAVIGELVGLHPSLWTLEQKIAEAVLQLAHVGRVIFAGRAANLITRGVPGGLHVRLVAPKEVRAERVAAMLNCPYAAAMTQLERNDLARRRYVRTHFDRDIEDPRLYDLVINTAHFTPAATTRLIVEVLHDRLHQLSLQPTACTFAGEPV